MLLEIAWEALFNSLQTMLQIIIIVMPIMMVLRFARELNIINKVSCYAEPFTKRLYFSKEATFPLIVGIFFGLTYGAGVIVQAAKEGRLTARDIILINVFLGLNHAVFEDTFLFHALGANAVLLFLTRNAAAIIFTYFIGRWLIFREKGEQRRLMEKLNI
ncbi:MAG: nucleoside recognition protein [Peptococcaceae bacterium]